MSTQATLGHDHRAFVRVEPSGLISASGVLVPRLTVELTLSTPRETVVAEIHHLRLQVKFENVNFYKSAAKLGRAVARTPGGTWLAAANDSSWRDR